MIDIPEEIKALYRKNNRSEETVKTARLRFYDGDIDLLYPGENVWPSDELFPIDDEPSLLVEGDQISSESFILSQGICPQKTLTFGQCSADKVEVIVANVNMDVTGKEFVLTIEAVMK